MIKLTYGEADTLLTDTKFKDFIDEKLPTVTSFKLLVILNKIKDDLKTYNEKKQGLFDKYANKTADGEFVRGDNNSLVFSGENGKKIILELNKLSILDMDIGKEKLNINMSSLPPKMSIKLLSILDIFCNINEDE